jgi:MarR family transcriptional regulator for hemolysin
MDTDAPPRVGVDLAFLLAQASHALTTELTVRLAEVDITPRSHCVLSKALTGELTQIRLAEMCALDKTTMVVTLDALEKAGLAERRPSSTDRRARIVAVTEAGAQVVERADAIIGQVYDDVLSALPPGEREGFVAGLTRLAAGRLSTPMECQQPVRRRAPKAPPTAT